MAPELLFFAFHLVRKCTMRAIFDFQRLAGGTPEAALTAAPAERPAADRVSNF
ncbi:hypothetical protein [Collimonas pratensis]|uniref:Uncharacterized protein n=1 Tax=Collimonas pratensis TaxID=279113 RepID=A0ABM5Z541_9BURK|nr:hypothetical protein [Collimonas pratensis]AMP14123.1 hypothetical protein CPter291_1857 [Collimonas pratensis]NKI68720.1 hypothetical protein [Collimonas pratensis]